MSAAACCKSYHISSISLEETPLKMHTNTASEIITGLGVREHKLWLLELSLCKESFRLRSKSHLQCRSYRGGRKTNLHRNQTVVYVTRYPTHSAPSNAPQSQSRSVSPGQQPAWLCRNELRATTRYPEPHTSGSWHPEP